MNTPCQNKGNIRNRNYKCTLTLSKNKVNIHFQFVFLGRLKEHFASLHVWVFSNASIALSGMRPAPPSLLVAFYGLHYDLLATPLSVSRKPRMFQVLSGELQIFSVFVWKRGPSTYKCTCSFRPSRLVFLSLCASSRPFLVFLSQTPPFSVPKKIFCSASKISASRRAWSLVDSVESSRSHAHDFRYLLQLAKVFLVSDGPRLCSSEFPFDVHCGWKKLQWVGDLFGKYLAWCSTGGLDRDGVFCVAPEFRKNNIATRKIFAT